MTRTIDRELYADSQPVRSRLNIGGSFPSLYNVDFLVDRGVMESWGHRLTEIIYLWSEGEVYIVTVTKNDWDTLADTSLKRLYVDPRLVRRSHAHSLAAGRRLKTFCIGEMSAPAVASKTNEELAQLYSAFVMRFRDFCAKNVVLWFITADRLYEELKVIVGSRTRDPERALEELTTSPRKSFLAQERVAFYKVAAEAAQDLEMWAALRDSSPSAAAPPRLQPRLRALARRFGWIPFEYVGPDLYDEDHYLAELISLASAGTDPHTELQELEASQAKRRVLHNRRRRQLKLSGREWRLFQDYHAISAMSLEKKEYCIRAQVYLQTQFLPVVSERVHVPVPSLRFMTEEEINSCLRGARAPRGIEKREEYSAFVASGSRLSIYTGRAATELHDIFRRRIEDTDSLTGDVACLGKARGPAKIVRRAAELGKVERGDILVSTMTTPDYTAAMRLAAAIVTDEGGIMSHAAIVSRELGLPCVIGTQNATRVFQDGDLLEVEATDGDYGVVRKVSSDGR